VTNQGVWMEVSYCPGSPGSRTPAWLLDARWRQASDNLQRSRNSVVQGAWRGLASDLRPLL